MSFLAFGRERFVKEHLALAPPPDDNSTAAPARYLSRQAYIRSGRLRNLGVSEEIIEQEFVLTRKRCYEAMRLMANTRGIMFSAYFRPHEVTRMANR